MEPDRHIKKKKKKVVPSTGTRHYIPITKLETSWICRGMGDRPSQKQLEGITFLGRFN